MEKPKMKIRNIRIHPDIDEQLVDLARRYGSSVNAMIGLILGQFVDGVNIIKEAAQKEIGQD